MPARAIATLLAKPVHEIPVGTLAQLRRAAASCHACPLRKPATQTVYGAGPEGARAILIGEQPGDQEDRQGLPFVGPAGRILDQALAAARLDRAALYQYPEALQVRAARQGAPAQARQRGRAGRLSHVARRGAGAP